MGNSAGKCCSCSEGWCLEKYEYRYNCDDPDDCTCTCQEDSVDTFAKGFLSIVGGVAAITGGVALTVATGGLGAVGIAAAVGGSALTGVGATAAIHPVAKKINGERMTGKDYVKDVVIGGTIGAVTGPIGMGGASVTTSIASKVGTEGVKQGAVKLGCRAAVGAVSGAASSAIQDGANGQFNVGNVLKGSLLGAATGGAAHLSGNVVNKVATTGVVRSVAKVAADTTSAVVLDASSQLIVDGKVDGKKLALNAGARAATSAGVEAVTNATYKFHGGKDVLRDKLGDKKILKKLDSKDRESAMEGRKFLERKLTHDEAEKQLLKAKEYTQVKREHQEMVDNLKAKEARKAAIDRDIEKLKNSAHLSREERANAMRPMQEEKNPLPRQITNLSKKIDKYQREVLSQMPEPDKLGGKLNVHALVNKERIGQFAADLPTAEGDYGRGVKRVVFDRKERPTGGKGYKIAGVIDDHDYSKVPHYGKVERPQVFNFPFRHLQLGLRSAPPIRASVQGEHQEMVYTLKAKEARKAAIDRDIEKLKNSFYRSREERANAMRTLQVEKNTLHREITNLSKKSMYPQVFKFPLHHLQP